MEKGLQWIVGTELFPYHFWEYWFLTIQAFMSHIPLSMFSSFLFLLVCLCIPAVKKTEIDFEMLENGTSYIFKVPKI